MDEWGKKLSIVFLVIFCLGFTIHGNAQTRTITGSVNDGGTGESLIGATIQLKGSSKGTITDVDGKFNLTLENTEDTIIVSYIGFLSEELSTKGKANFQIVLTTDIATIGDVVVIGYGTQKKSDLTGAIAVIDNKDIARSNASTIDRALQGRAAGVMVTSTSGQPGSGVSIRIRGVGSINASSDPLYIVDGLITDSRGLNSINPSDIESLQVLKDASAASIYGAQGANGVVLITTKKGEKGKTNITFTSYIGSSVTPKYYDIMNGLEYTTLMDSAWSIARRNDPSLSDAFQQVYKDYIANPNREEVNMPKILTQTGLKQDYSLSATGGGEHSRYALSGNYYNEKGTLINTSFKRYAMRMNSEFDVYKRWKIGETFSASRLENRTPSSSGVYGLWSTALITSPIMHLYEPANLGGYGGPDENVTGANDKGNPFAVQNLEEYSNYSNKMSGSIFSDLEIVENLKYKMTFGFDFSDVYSYNWAPAYYLGPYGNRNNPVSTLTERNDHSRNLLISNVLTYGKKIVDHNFNLMIGQEAVNGYSNYTSATGSDFTSDAVNVLNQAQINNSINGETYEHRTLSYFGRVMYDYRGKYLFTSSIRRDGSSNFGPNNRIGWFPSFALGWKINEDFLNGIDQINLLKLRVGWGMTGNENIGYYRYNEYIESPRQSRYVLGLDQHTVYGGTVIRSFGNESVQWEAAQMTNIGLDLNAFNNKIQFTAEYYSKNQEKMLVQVDLPRVFGRQNPDANPWVNIGEVQNNGIELNLTYKQLDREFTYLINGNFTTINNKVISLPNHNSVYNGLTITSEDHAIGSFYGYIADGIFQSSDEVANHAYQNAGTQPGDIRFRDLNTDGTIDDEDRTIIGKPIPDFIYGINLECGYKNFDFSLFLQGVQGVEIYNQLNASIGVATDNSGHDNNRLRSAMDYWSETNPTNSMTRLSIVDEALNSRNSSWFIEDGSYLRLKNIQLGYTFTKKVTTALKISSLRLYVSATNLITFSKYSGLDPEIPSSNPLYSNIDDGQYPIPKSYTAGVQINF